MQEAIKAREINYVWHFARLSNLESILKNGLIGREQLEGWDVPPEFNDEYRFDLQKNAVCCSLGHPNYKMFYKLRMNNPEEEWVVVACKSEILWKKDCAFCAENAASNNVTRIPIQERKGIQAFNRMFDEIGGIPSRINLTLPDDYPTNPQAEILVFGNIEPEYFEGVICASKTKETELKAMYQDFDFQYHSAFFEPREDYEHWS